MIFLLWWCSLLWVSEGLVLDPALYLAPSPPLTPASDDLSAADIWQKRIQRDLDDLAVVPIVQIQPKLLKTSPSSPLKLTTPSEPTTPMPPTTTEAQEMMDKAETLWPRLQPYFGSIHIPLTFSLTGNYGGYGRYGPAGVIGSSYMSVNDDPYGSYGKTGLAGSSYGNYGTRLYGGNKSPAWSGWGNGKWGHYGKG